MASTRRELMAGLAALVVAAQLPRTAHAAFAHPSPNDEATVTPFVGVDRDGTVTILCPSSEMGQGVTTALAQIVAEELDADWASVRVLHADEAAPYRSAILPMVKFQATGGSMSVRVWWTPLREAGARARAMLVAAAAARWSVDPATCTTSEGVVRHPSGAQATYAELAEDAGRQAEPRRVPLKDPSTFRIVGTSRPREDLLAKVTGAGIYGIDVRLEGMVYAYPVPCPVFGGRLVSVDDRRARAEPGVLDVLVFDDTVTVVARRWWQARRAAGLLDLQWDPGDAGTVDSDQLLRELHEALDDRGGFTARKAGRALPAFEADGARIVEATYEVPYLEHATMEPLNCTVHLQSDRCDVWVGTQAPSMVRMAAARITKVRRSDIHVHTSYLGGGYGRRANNDWVVHALEVATRVDAPVQVLWDRELTTQQGRYRPAQVARFRAVVSDDGLEALHGRIAGDNSASTLVPKLLHGTGFYRGIQTQGLVDHDSPYVFEQVRHEVMPTTSHVPVGQWRSVAQSHNAFFRECFLDEVAHALGRDPAELRRGLIPARDTRFHELLDRLLDEAGWGHAPDGHGHGLALTHWEGTRCGQVVEVRVDDDGPRIVKLTAVVDCGIVVNPDQTKAQIMGGAIMGLSAAWGEAITVTEGRVAQSNFHDYRLMRMNEAPLRVDVHLMDRRDQPPTGAGEPGTPPAAPALCNALFAATGVRHRTLPLIG